MTAEYEPPEPGERDSIQMLVDRIEGTVEAIREEIPLFLSMYTSLESALWLLDKLSRTRQGLQALEIDANNQMDGALA